MCGPAGGRISAPRRSPEYFISVCAKRPAVRSPVVFCVTGGRFAMCGKGWWASVFLHVRAGERKSLRGTAGAPDVSYLYTQTCGRVDRLPVCQPSAGHQQPDGTKKSPAPARASRVFRAGCGKRAAGARDVWAGKASAGPASPGEAGFPGEVGLSGRSGAFREKWGFPGEVGLSGGGEAFRGRRGIPGKAGHSGRASFCKCFPLPLPLLSFTPAGVGRGLPEFRRRWGYNRSFCRRGTFRRPAYQSSRCRSGRREWFSLLRFPCSAGPRRWRP